MKLNMHNMEDIKYPFTENVSPDEMPVKIPASFEEALADIEMSEIEFKEGKGIAWDDVKHMMEEHICSYAY